MLKIIQSSQLMKNNYQDKDFNKLIDSNSDEFDVDLYSEIINKFGSIENYKSSDEWKGITDIYNMIELIKQSN